MKRKYELHVTDSTGSNPITVTGTLGYYFDYSEDLEVRKTRRDTLLRHIESALATARYLEENKDRKHEA